MGPRRCLWLLFLAAGAIATHPEDSEDSCALAQPPRPLVIQPDTDRFLACVKRMLPKSPIPPREVASVSNSSVGSEVDDARKRWAKEWFYQGMQNMVKKVGAIALKAAISGFWSEILGSLWQAFFPPPLWKEYSVMKLMMEWTEQYVQRTIAAELKDDIAGKMCDLEDATGELNKCMASLKEEIEKAKKQRHEVEDPYYLEDPPILSGGCGGGPARAPSHGFASSQVRADDTCAGPISRKLVFRMPRQAYSKGNRKQDRDHRAQTGDGSGVSGQRLVSDDPAAAALQRPPREGGVRTRVQESLRGCLGSHEGSDEVSRCDCQKHHGWLEEVAKGPTRNQAVETSLR